jgi:hypothetical protein
MLYSRSDDAREWSTTTNTKPPANQPTNMRALHQRTDRNLIIGALVILFVVGGGLIWLLYGLDQALMAEVCMGGLLAVFGGLYWLIVKLLQALSDSADE